MQVIVRVELKVANELHERSPPTTLSEEPLKIIQALGLRLEPMHPGTVDQDLIKYFIVEVSDSETAYAVIDLLQNVRGIESVYLKPPDERL